MSQSTLKKNIGDSKSKIEQVEKAVEIVLDNLPVFWKEFRSRQLSRVIEEISWIYTDGGTVIDLGGSNGFHASVCSVLGMRAICVDNFKVRGLGSAFDYFYEHDLQAEKCSKNLGVEFIHTDLLSWEPPFQAGEVDVVMSFDNIEHLHHSPKKVYKNVVNVMKENGVMLIGAPNAVNLLKRIRLVFGKSCFATVEEWYEHDMFIGHVREPVIKDYLYISKDLGLAVDKIIGRNWLGYLKYGNNVFIKSIDKILRLNPNLCSDIYLLAKKI